MSRTHLKLGKLLHELLLLLGVAQWRNDVQEDLQQIETLSRHAGQSEDGCDAARKNTVTISVNNKDTKLLVSPFTYASYLGDWANCCAAVTASSLLVMTMGTLLQPGCFNTRSSWRTVRSTVARVQRSTLLITMKMGTFSAMAIPRCSRVVPAIMKREEEEVG